jgi:hypothetical protein
MIWSDAEMMQHFVLTWEPCSAMNNKVLGTLLVVFVLSLHWTCQWLHSIALGDEALGVLAGLMILLAVMWDRDKKSARPSIVRCMRLLVWAVVLIVMGWLEPLMMAIVPGELGRMLPGILGHTFQLSRGKHYPVEAIEFQSPLHRGTRFNCNGFAVDCCG